MPHKCPIDQTNLNSVGRSYYCYLIESALRNIKQAKALMAGDVIIANHELLKIETLLIEALEAS